MSDLTPAEQRAVRLALEHGRLRLENDRLRAENLTLRTAQATCTCQPKDR